MEYSNEFLAKIYMAYAGAKVEYGYNGNKKIGTVTGNNAITGIEIFDISRLTHLHTNVNPELCHLFLSPLSDISDEDAIEVAMCAVRHQAHINFDRLKIYIDQRDSESTKIRVGGALVSVYNDGRVIVSNSIAQFIYVPTCNQTQITDFLRQRGYDLGYGEIPSLIEAGIAVKKKG